MITERLKTARKQLSKELNKGLPIERDLVAVHKAENVILEEWCARATFDDDATHWLYGIRIDGAKLVALIRWVISIEMERMLEI